jgi:hypothetical protein
MPAAEWLVSQARDGRVGRPGHEHEPVRKLSPQELFEQGPAGAVALGPDVAVVEGEDVEHDERRRAGEREVLGPQVGGVDALLQGGEVQPALPPQDQFPVEHHIGVELSDGVHDLGEVAGEGTLATRSARRWAMQRIPGRASTG